MPTNALQNDTSFIRVLNCAQLAAKHPDVAVSADGRGPFAVWQEGVAPGDLSFTVQEFFLTREGTWMPLTLFFAMEVELRRSLCLYQSAADAYEAIAALVGAPKVYGLPRPEADGADES